MTEHWENLNALTAPLLTWYDLNGRTLPWRSVVTPYRTWVSEIMLQQTRVSAVIPYFERFMAELPDAAALATVPEERLLKLWEGLGYYSRARNLQKAAKVIVSDFGGELPRTCASLKTLPGIGDYTAAAIASINFGEPVAAVDGNLLRVAARVSGCADDIMDARVRKQFTAHLNDAIDLARPGAYNQAMMELGATVCTAKAPLCDRCPIAGQCVFLRNGRPGLGERRTRPRQRFQGTDRQVRGLVLNALRELPAGSVLEREQAERLWKDRIQLDACIASLDDDGLVEMLPDGSLRLPQ